MFLTWDGYVKPVPCNGYILTEASIRDKPSIPCGTWPRSVLFIDSIVTLSHSVSSHVNYNNKWVFKCNVVQSKLMLQYTFIFTFSSMVQCSGRKCGMTHVRNVIHVMLPAQSRVGAALECKILFVTSHNMPLYEYRLSLSYRSLLTCFINKVIAVHLPVVQLSICTQLLCTSQTVS